MYSSKKQRVTMCTMRFVLRLEPLGQQVSLSLLIYKTTNGFWMCVISICLSLSVFYYYAMYARTFECV